jgi:hypothetical protein
MGSIFHGDNTEKQGGGAGNHIKSFYDKSGTYYRFNTKDGSYEVYSLKGDSRFFIDGKGNASLSTPKTITLMATDIVLKASNSIKLLSQPGENGGDTGAIGLFAEENIKINSETADIALTAKSENVTISADNGKLGVSTDKTEMSSKGDTRQSSGGVFYITGASNVEINR